MKLFKAVIHKYKCINSDQTIELNPDVTVLVGMNESGKTTVLECLAKTNYFESDDKFKFNATHDYPRKEKKSMEKSGKTPHSISATYELDDDLITEIENDIGEGVFTQKTFTVKTKYNNVDTFSDISSDTTKFLEAKLKNFSDYTDEQVTRLGEATSQEDINELLSEIESEELKEELKLILPYFENKWGWSTSPISEYISRVHLAPNQPKFLYYDEYYALPSRISIEKLQSEQLESEELKTAKALFDLADINIEELINADDFEDFKAELEATEAIISEELFEYWSSNKHLDISFDIDKVTHPNNTHIIEHILDVRVKNSRTRVSLPLKNRSKGFNWLFSFLVWFKKIQEDQNSNYILLLDEPGLNLHASAQADLLNFIENLSENYQIIYTTHSPFMVPSTNLDRVRTVVDTEQGSSISDSVQEKDPNTLFPLQAALGYDIAQNLYISKNNLLVEGVSDLIYLQIMSGLMSETNRTPLKDDITIVPVGGLEKVSTFVSLLRGNNLNITCLLDSAIDPSSKSKLDKMVKEKIVKEKKIVFYDQFLESHKEADIEDIFTKSDYLKLFTGASPENKGLVLSDLNDKIDRIILQLNKHLNVRRFNHYAPANYLARQAVKPDYFEEETLDRFDELFKTINGTF